MKIKSKLNVVPTEKAIAAASGDLRKEDNPNFDVDVKFDDVKSDDDDDSNSS